MGDGCYESKSKCTNKYGGRNDQTKHFSKLGYVEICRYNMMPSSSSSASVFLLLFLPAANDVIICLAVLLNSHACGAGQALRVQCFAAWLRYRQRGLIGTAGIARVLLAKFILRYALMASFAGGLQSQATYRGLIGAACKARVLFTKFILRYALGASFAGGCQSLTAYVVTFVLWWRYYWWCWRWWRCGWKFRKFRVTVRAITTNCVWVLTAISLHGLARLACKTRGSECEAAKWLTFSATATLTFHCQEARRAQQNNDESESGSSHSFALLFLSLRRVERSLISFSSSFAASATKD